MTQQEFTKREVLSPPASQVQAAQTGWGSNKKSQENGVTSQKGTLLHDGGTKADKTDTFLTEAVLETARAAVSLGAETRGPWTEHQNGPRSSWGWGRTVHRGWPWVWGLG